MTASGDLASTATATSIAKSTSAYTGPFSALSSTPRILVWVAIGLGAALLLALASWAICCCRRQAAAARRARESTFGDGAFGSAAGRGGAVRLPIRHPSHVGSAGARGGYGEMGRGVDRRELRVDTDRAKWDNGLASPRSPYEDDKSRGRGWSGSRVRGWGRWRGGVTGRRRRRGTRSTTWGGMRTRPRGEPGRARRARRRRGGKGLGGFEREVGGGGSGTSWGRESMMDNSVAWVLLSIGLACLPKCAVTCRRGVRRGAGWGRPLLCGGWHLSGPACIRVQCASRSKGESSHSKPI